jgi:hypothetical protein
MEDTALQNLQRFYVSYILGGDGLISPLPLGYAAPPDVIVFKIIRWRLAVKKAPGLCPVLTTAVRSRECPGICIEGLRKNQEKLVRKCILRHTGKIVSPNLSH